MIAQVVEVQPSHPRQVPQVEAPPDLPRLHAFQKIRQEVHELIHLVLHVL